MAIAGILELQLLADMARLSTDMKRAERVVQDSTDKMGRSVATLESAFGKLGGTLALGAVFDQVRRLTDDFTKLNAQIRIATRSQEEYVAGLADVRRISTAAQADINATAMLYTRITNSLREMGASQKQVSNITEAVSLGLKAYGATATEAASAMLQLSQAFGANRLGGEEFRAVSEAMPNMMQVLAKSMGVPLSALKNLSAEGKITRAEMMKAWDNPEVIASMRAQADQTRTITGEMTIFRNNLKMLVGEFMGASGSTSGITTALRGMSDGVLLLANNLAQVVSLAAALSVAFVGKYLVSVAAARVETMALNAAHGEAIAMNLAMAKAAQANATAQFGVAYAAGVSSSALMKSALAADAGVAAAEKLVAAQTTMMGRFLAANKTGLIGLALWGAYEVANHLGWIDQVFGSATKRVNEFQKAVKGMAADELYAQRQKLTTALMLEEKSWMRNGETVSQYRQQLSLVDREINRLGATEQTTAAERVAVDRTAWEKLTNNKAQQRQAEIAALDEQYLKIVQGQNLTHDQQLAEAERYNVALKNINDKYGKDAAKEISHYAQVMLQDKERLAVLQAQLDRADKLSQAEKDIAKFKEAQAAGLTRMTAAQQASHLAELNLTVSMEKAVAAKTAQEIATKKANDEAAKAAGYAKEQIEKIDALEKARTKEMAFQVSLQSKSKDEQELMLAQHRENLRYEKEIADIKGSHHFAGNNPAVIAEMEKVIAKAKAAHIIIAASIEPTINEAHMNAELNKVRDNFKGVFDGLLEPGVNVFKKIADSSGAAVNKSIKDALDAALFGDMRDRLAKSVTDGMKPIITTIRDAKSKLDAWAIDVFGTMGGAAKGSDAAKQTGMGVSDAMVQLGVALFSRLSRNPTLQQLNSVNQQYVQQWQGTGTVLGDMSAKSTSIVNAMDTLNKTTFAHTDYLAQMNTSMRSMDKNMSSLLTELGKTLGVTGLSQTPIGGTITTKVISDGLATLGNIIGSFFGMDKIGSLLQGFFGSSSTTVTGTGVNFGGTAKQLQQGQGGSQYTSGVTTSSSLFGLVSDTSVWTQYYALNANVTKALGAVFVDIGKTIKAAAVSLGGDAATLQKQLDAFVISTGNVSLAGMNVQQQQQALTNIVSQQSDLMVAAVVPSMKAFQVSGEGLLQTLVRVVSEIATLTEFNKMLGDKTIVTAASADKLITALGGVDAANQAMTKFVSNFAPETVKSAQALNALNVALKNAGLAGVAPLIKTTQDYFALMQVASADQRVLLLQQQDTALAYIKSVGSAMNLMLDSASKSANAAKNELGFVISNLSSLAGSLKGAAQSLYQSFMQQMTPDYQRQQYKASLVLLQDAYTQYKATGVAPNAASLQQAVSNVSQGGTQIFTSALDWKRSTMQTIDLLSGMGNLADAQVTVLTQISGTMDKLLATQQEQLAATNAGNTSAAADAAGRAAVLSANLQWLQGVNDIVTKSAAQNTLIIDLVAQTVSATSGGTFALIDTLQKYIVSGGTTMVGSGATTGIRGATSSAGSSLAAGTSASALNQVAGASALNSFSTSGVLSAQGASNTLTSMLPNIQAGGQAADAAAAAAAAKASADAALAEIVSAGNTALAALKKYWNTWPSNLPTDTANGDSLNSAMSAYNAVANANSGVAGAKAVIKSEATQFADFMRQYAPTRAYLGGAAAAYVNNAKTNYVAQAAALPSFAVGSNYIPKDMTANIHAGEEITPRPYVDMQRAAREETNALLARMASASDAANAELKAVRAELADIRRTNQNMDWNLDKWDNEGMPEVRVS